MSQRTKIMPLRTDRLKQIREQRGLTQEELSKLTGITLRTMGRYEQGKTDPPTDALARIALSLDISTDYLSGLTNEPRHFLARADLDKSEAELIGAYRRGDFEAAFHTFSKKMRKDIPPQTIIPRRKK